MDTAIETASSAQFDPALRGLRFLWIELTRKCNLNCVHCYADSGPLEPLFRVMQLADWKLVLEQSFELGCRSVQFIGGEPAIHPHLIDLMQYSRALGYEFVEVFTNGTVLSEELRNAVRSLRVSLAFSIYSHKTCIHDAITLGEGSWLKTIESITWAVREGVDISVSIIEMNQNASTISATRDFIAGMGVAHIGIDRVLGVGRGATVKNGNKDTEPLDELCGNCWKGKLCVTSGGDLLPCVFARFWPVGMAANGIHAALEGNRLLAFRSIMRAKCLDRNRGL